MEAWQKGEFGNPVGVQPKVNALRKACQNFSKQAWDTLVDLVSNPMGDEKNRRVIATWMLEQAWGRVPQSMEMQADEGLSPNMMSAEQLRMFASGKVKELILNLHQTGKLDEYLKSNQLSLEAQKDEAS